MTLWNLYFLWLRTRWRGGYYGPGGLVRECLLSGANLCTNRKSCGIGEAHRGFKFELGQHALTELVTISDLSLIVNLLFCIGLLDPKKPALVRSLLVYTCTTFVLFYCQNLYPLFRWTSLFSTNTGNSCIDVKTRKLLWTEPHPCKLPQIS